MQQHKKYAWKIKTVQYDLKELLKKYLVKIIKKILIFLSGLGTGLSTKDR